MPYDLKNRLVIGVASRAVCDLVASDAVFQSRGGGVPLVSARKPPRPASKRDSVPLHQAFTVISFVLAGYFSVDNN